jgi:hypothetical protein
MRTLPLAMGLLLLMSHSVLAAETAKTSTPQTTINALQKGERCTEVFVGITHTDGQSYRVKYTAWKGGEISESGELNVLQDDRGFSRTFAGIRAAGQGFEGRVAALLYVDNVAAGTDEKLKHIYAEEAASLSSLQATQLNFAGLHFVILVPGADRIELTVDRHTVQGQDWKNSAPTVDELRAMTQQRISEADFVPVASYSGPLNTVAGEVWMPLPQGQPMTGS